MVLSQILPIHFFILRSIWQGRDQSFFTQYRDYIKTWAECYLPQNTFSITHNKPLFVGNRPRSIYQYSNMAPRLSEQTSIFGVVFCVSKSLLEIKRQRKLKKFAILTRKPRIHDRILVYGTWPITCRSRGGLSANEKEEGKNALNDILVYFFPISTLQY